MKPRVAIIYLCWGMRDYLSPVVEALARQTYAKESMKIFFTTAGSPDGIQEAIRETVLPRSGVDLAPSVLIDDPENRGFAGNNNVAVRQALEEGFDYIFLHNGDLKLHEKAIEELVELCESDKAIGSAQSLVLYWKDHETVNVSGGVFHIAGYGYARDNLQLFSNVSYTNGEEVAYASGAAVMYRADALKKVGLLEEGFFMYHEDLELGLRLRMAGYKNVLCSKSWAYHDYKFSRNPKMFSWTELYRWVVLKAYYKVPTLLLLTPLLLMIEMGTWVMALRGGWLKAKLWAYQEALKPKTWRLVWRMRKRAQRLRTMRDKELLGFVTGRIEAQEQSNWLVDKVANPVIETWFKLSRAVIFW